MSTPAVSSVRPTHQQQRVDSAFSCAFSCSWLKVCKRRGYCVLLVANLFQCAAVLVLEDHMIFLPLVTCWRYKIGSPPATTLSYYKSKASDSHQQHHHKGTLYPQVWSAISVWFYSALDTRHLKLLAPCHPLKRRPKLSLSRRQSLREVLPTRDESPYRISSEESFQGKKTVSLKLSEHTCIITLSKYILQHQQGHMTSIRGLPAERSQNL